MAVEEEEEEAVAASVEEEVEAAAGEVLEEGVAFNATKVHRPRLWKRVKSRTNANRNWCVAGQ